MAVDSTPRKRRDSLGSSLLRTPFFGTPFSRKSSPRATVSSRVEDYGQPPKFALQLGHHERPKDSLKELEEVIVELDDPFTATAVAPPRLPARSAKIKFKEVVKRFTKIDKIRKQHQEPANGGCKTEEVTVEEEIVTFERVTRKSGSSIREVVSSYQIVEETTYATKETASLTVHKNDTKSEFEFERILPLGIRARSGLSRNKCLASTGYNSCNGSYDQCEDPIRPSLEAIALDLDDICTTDPANVIEKISSFLAQGPSIPFCETHRGVANKHLRLLHRLTCNVKNSKGKELLWDLQDCKKVTFAMWISAIASLGTATETPLRSASIEIEVNSNEEEDRDLASITNVTITSNLRESVETKKSTIKTARTTFSRYTKTGELKFVEILPTDLHLRFAKSRKMCLASNTTEKKGERKIGERCRRPLSKVQLPMTISRLRIPSDFDPQDGVEQIVLAIREAIPVMFCGSHHGIANKHLNSIFEWLKKLKESKIYYLDLEDSTGLAFTDWIEALAKPLLETTDDISDTEAQQESRTRSSTPDIAFAQSSPSSSKVPSNDAGQPISGSTSALLDEVVRPKFKTCSSTCQNRSYFDGLIPYKPKVVRGMEIEKLPLRDVLYRLISYPFVIKYPKISGWIYMYSIPNKPEAFKIGYTTERIENRVDGWAKRCNYATEILYLEHLRELGPIPYVALLEDIIHQQLGQWRQRVIGCQSCSSDHREWFILTASFACKMIEIWASWMKTKPYKIRDTCNTRKSATFELKPNINLEELKEFCNEMEAAAQSYPSKPVVSHIPAAG